MGVMVQRLDAKEEWSLHFVALEEKKKKTHNKHMARDMTAFIYSWVDPSKTGVLELLSARGFLGTTGGKLGVLLSRLDS